MDDLLSEFLTETSESLSVLDVELVKLEQNPEPAILQNIFRLVHTIKGTCGFLGLPRLEHVAHAGENVLGKFRDGELEVTPSAVTLILQAIDRIKLILGHLEQNECEPEGSDEDLIASLNDMAEGRYVAPGAAGAAPAVEEPSFPVAADLLAEVEAAYAAGKRAASDTDVFAEMAKERAKEEAAKAAAAAPAAAPPPPPEPPKASVPAVPPSPPAQTKEVVPAGTAPAAESAVAAQTIRVNVELLENLMTLVSELVLTRNQLLQMVRGRDDSEFTAPLQRLSHITTDLQEGVMKTRMQPIGNAWAKLPRIVRDLSVEMSKKIDLQMLGAETELDRQVLELIKDPLTHMVRNSADHGLEGPEERKAAGKPEVGKVVLNAFHEGGHIIIEISDDGRGLNLDRIKQKAISNNLATESELESMAPQQIYQFIFKAGFSTAEKVTSVSGRGVGMDVVRTNIEKIGGTVELKSYPGKGSTFVIKIPLTLAIVSALIVECAAERFAIPQISVLELVRVTNNSEHGIELINNAPVLRLRDRLLPLVSLKKLLRLSNGEDQETFIVVTQVGTYTFGIIVDRVFDTEEIVVKPVAPILRHISMFSGNTILGDGSVIMILDPNGIAGATGESGVLGGGQTTEQTVTRDKGNDSKTSLLVFRACGDDLKAVPLALVARLEEIDIKDVEYSHGKPMVQYRGHLMPLVSIDGTTQFREEGRQPVLVFSDREHTMGLAVDEIVDIVEDRLKVELTADNPGVIGTAVIAGKATTIIDAGYYLPQAFGDWFGRNDKEYGEDEGSQPRILLVDDSPFFRNLLVPLLSVAGYDVTAVEAADRALALREQSYEFDIIISDIEMPGMSGFEFATAVRADGRWFNTPMIALSSHATEKDFERGRQVGFNDYVAKFDRDSLLQTIASTLATLKGAA
ncbi:chemotaxis protein CheW [Magnetospirillum sulfuroxidans]|uniref:histidine kinase n=1 Tax=Magnetospirillum sulfuroxidans TaxID=611300 RepID=A0ABS5IF62_9PROT|nr:chemotaxis protein CheW [Magnetospirillum sulfuroxidans]MBR9973052.1 chemotaxis protein CheW [Magnetospirillum sulfuroxidans]